MSIRFLVFLSLIHSLITLYLIFCSRCVTLAPGYGNVEQTPRGMRAPGLRTMEITPRYQSEGTTPFAEGRFTFEAWLKPFPSSDPTWDDALAGDDRFAYIFIVYLTTQNGKEKKEITFFPFFVL